MPQVVSTHSTKWSMKPRLRIVSFRWASTMMVMLRTTGKIRRPWGLRHQISPNHQCKKTKASCRRSMSSLSLARTQSAISTRTRRLRAFSQLRQRSKTRCSRKGKTKLLRLKAPIWPSSSKAVMKTLTSSRSSIARCPTSHTSNQSFCSLSNPSCLCWTRKPRRCPAGLQSYPSNPTRPTNSLPTWGRYRCNPRTVFRLNSPSSHPL